MCVRSCLCLFHTYSILVEIGVVCFESYVCWQGARARERGGGDDEPPCAALTHTIHTNTHAPASAPSPPLAMFAVMNERNAAPRTCVRERRSTGSAAHHASGLTSVGAASCGSVVAGGRGDAVVRGGGATAVSRGSGGATGAAAAAGDPGRRIAVAATLSSGVLIGRVLVLHKLPFFIGLLRCSMVAACCILKETMLYQRCCCTRQKRPGFRPKTPRSRRLERSCGGV